MNDPATAWPDLDFAAWAATKKSLHLYTQMLGKLRLALAPHQPNWMFTSLALTARGVTTGAMPWGDRSVQATVDVFSSELIVEMSDGRTQRIALLPPRTIAAVFADLRAALNALGINAIVTTTPQEVADVTPLDTDTRPVTYDAAAVQRWFGVATATGALFDEWRAHFFGRTGIQLWWGAMDLSLMLFSGRHVDPPTDRGYLLKYDLDAELMNVGFYPGDDANPRAIFYGYIYPQPDECASIDLGVPNLFWSQQLGEWILPYDAVRTSPDPRGNVRAFLEAIYTACGSAAGWDRAALSYARPKTARLRPA